jgi:hypothetical protein
MIYAFNFTCDRDTDLSVLMCETLKKHCPGVRLSIANTDHDAEFKGYGNGAGWPASMLKLKRMRHIVEYFNPTDQDYILSVDSDVVFTSPEVFKYVKPEYGIIGTKHRPEFHTHFGNWSHMSGALIFIRGDIAKKMVAIGESELNAIRFQHFKAYQLTENEDVVLSYLAKFVGAEYFELNDLRLSSGDFESDIWTQHADINGFGLISHVKSFYHLNYCPAKFLGEPVNGKWDIPRILKQKGIEL